jgi:rSAM/selenodomain-associated transferase 1
MNPPTPPRSHAPALIIFAKAPTPGRVKTRLTERLTEAEAARLYEAFLRDTLAQYAALAETRGAALRLYHAGPDWPAALAPEGASLHRQRSGGLGARMAAAFRETFAAGAGTALIAGTDCPTLPPAFLGEAFDTLQREAETVCIGPSTDGGYYLLGTRRPAERLFDDMSYSHSGVFDQTLARIAETGRTPVVLPEWYDVDRPADLHRLAADLSDRAAAARAPRTRRQIRTLAEQYPALRRPALRGTG